MRKLAVWGLMASLLGCAPELVPGRYGCETNSECPDNWICGTDDRCYPNGQAPDASSGDTDDGGLDAGSRDAGTDAEVDAGADAGMDGGIDAGVDAGADAGADAGEDAGADAGADGEVPCTPRPVNVDVLLMVDQSASMTAAQSLLQESVRELVELIVTRDLDGDSVADFPAIDSLHMGVITSDMGAYSSTVPTCDFAGDDGVLLTTHQGSDTACGGAFAPIQVYEGGPGQAAYVNRVQCLADVGPAGCGFEQQLDAVLKALTPAGSAVRFFDGSLGHGDGANAGFLREDSILVTLILSDENDCSTHNAALFTDSSMFPSELNQRCGRFPDALLPTNRFSNGLLALRDDPADLIFAAIIGVPLGSELRTPTDLLGDARMDVTFDGGGIRPDPACVVSGAAGSVVRQGDPGRRYVEVARDIDAMGGDVAIHSICEPNFDGMSLDLLQKLAPRVRARTCETEM